MNVKRLTQAQDFYNQQGFKYISAPWTTDWDVNIITAPPEAHFFPIDNKLLVASGEQSFIQLLKDKKLQGFGRHQTITPCFRDDKLDELHQRYFIKLELIDLDPSPSGLQKIVEECSNFFNQFFNTEVIETSVGFDIIDSKNKIEVGSYGIRETTYGSFIYGTGLAEPRFDIVLGKQ